VVELAAVVGGRVGGLVSPPLAARVDVVPAALGALVVVVVPGRRMALVVVVPGRFTGAVVVVVVFAVGLASGFVSPLALASSAGSSAVGSGDRTSDVSSFTSSLGTSEESSIEVGGTSSTWGVSTFSTSAIAQGLGQLAASSVMDRALLFLDAYLKQRKIASQGGIATQKTMQTKKQSELLWTSPSEIRLYNDALLPQ
jgi:hypothetical protein